MKTDIYQRLKTEFGRIIEEHNLESESVIINAVPLTPEESIGNPEDKDYPLITGRERLMQAQFHESFGQAFTDMYGDYSGTIEEVLSAELTNNYRRAILVASINAVMKHLGLISCSVHCRNNEPRQCSQELVNYIAEQHGKPKIAQVGLQPRMVEALAPKFTMRVSDLDKENIGQVKYGVRIDGPEETQKNLKWCDIALVTGTTVVNGTIEQFLISKPVIFYGVTISGPARLLGLTSFCSLGK